MPADQALKKLESELGENAVPLIQQDDELGTAIVLMNRATDEATLERPTRAWLHWLLFALTFVTTTYAGALHQGVNLWEQPGAFTVGLPYSIETVERYSTSPLLAPWRVWLSRFRHC